MLIFEPDPLPEPWRPLQDAMGGDEARFVWKEWTRGHYRRVTRRTDKLRELEAIARHAEELTKLLHVGGGGFLWFHVETADLRQSVQGNRRPTAAEFLKNRERFRQGIEFLSRLPEVAAAAAGYVPEDVPGHESTLPHRRLIHVLAWSFAGKRLKISGAENSRFVRVARVAFSCAGINADTKGRMAGKAGAVDPYEPHGLIKRMINAGELDHFIELSLSPPWPDEGG